MMLRYRPARAGDVPFHRPGPSAPSVHLRARLAMDDQADTVPAPVGRKLNLAPSAPHRIHENDRNACARALRTPDHPSCQLQSYSRAKASPVERLSASSFRYATECEAQTAWHVLLLHTVIFQCPAHEL